MDTFVKKAPELTITTVYIKDPEVPTIKCFFKYYNFFIYLAKIASINIVKLDLKIFY